MSKNIEEKQDKVAEEGFASLQNGLNRVEQFFEDNQKPIGIGFLATIVLFALGWLYKTQYVEPQKSEAQAQMFFAQYSFEADSFRLALDGDGLNPGFLTIIDEYSSAPAGNLARYYAGVCYLHLGEYDNAKKYLNDFSSDDQILNSYAVGLIGDAEVELGNEAAAISQFQKAVKFGNKVTAPVCLEKLGNLYEKQGRAEEAVAAYQQIKDDYPMSPIAQGIDKSINSVKK